RLQEKGIRYSDCALLLRTSKEMKIYSDVLSKYGIPSYYREKEGLTNSYAFNMLFNLLNFLDNKTREASLLVILKTILNVSYADLYELSKVEGRHLYDKLKTTDLKAFIEVKEKIEYWIKFAEDATAYDVVKEVVQSEYLYEYFAGRDLENSEMDYYENVLTILKK
ncbi:hypothetical protein IR145_17270, partial [Streptococcus danieliae]|nr:hypothetical protein [Streptococcus danieliae]